ncbi:hypothetical protein JOE60_002618 [Paenarthrobacter ilicis]|uniref:Uncharacterized protein n=1 Tax=Paenarthrobacter ilicis TaxID=43665 RepID=A0ABX0TCI5_9MICC|nr:hypothetical protein [Paenarthrobacter ilicis]NIJ00207.1 hypothetical protein [Paenarthrobacter ilicis]
MIVDRHVGWDTNSDYLTRLCVVGNMPVKKVDAPAERAGASDVALGHWDRRLMNDSRATLLFWSGRISQPRM